MAPPRPPLPLIDDVMAEIFFRLPPDEPEHLFRAALVCKPWLRILCDPGFLRRYGAFHGAPPLLGLLHRLQVLEGSPPPRFVSTTSMPNFPHPGTYGGHTRSLDCRHGRVLVYMLEFGRANCLVWDPVTGDRHAVPAPDMEDWLIESAAVLCATHGCDHLDCHGGPFRVVFMATHDYKPTIFACVYSSETGAWSQQISLDSSCEHYAQHMQEGLAVRSYYLPYLQPRRGTLVGDAIYNTIRLDNTIVKYDWCKNRLSLIHPPSKDVYYIALMALDSNTLGFASILGSSLHMWSMKMETEEAVEWLQYRVIELEKIIPVANPNDARVVVVGSAEGVGVIFVSTDVGLFSIDLKSERVKKVDEPGVHFSVLPYMSFYTPDRGRLLSLARGQ
ncbi:hypothetical protein BDA96_02G022700 [Sorghum bicolor]|uniref:F-box domain-containing protein n=1 Tax=Sorghum bicolor TaxID=4558 RepID=A0A921USG1_SORBI|nr:hypothetical protein BDA96_02G022700 [Sorghum bicolor]